MKLINALGIVSKCVPKNDLIKSLSYILFNNGKVVGYNGAQAVIVKSKEVRGLTCAIPANISIPLFKSFGSANVELSCKGSALVVACGKTKAKLVTIPINDFIFSEKSLPVEGEFLELGSEFLDALDDCSKTIDDKEITNRCGIYLVTENNKTVMYSSDGLNISRYRFDNSIVDIPVMLPDLFCQMLLVNRHYFENSSLLIGDSGIVVKAKGITLYTQITNIDNMPDFEKVWKEYDVGDVNYITVDNDIIDAVERCTIILPQDKKPIELTLENGVLTMLSESSYGIMNIPIKVPSKDSSSIVIDGIYLEPFIKQVSEFAIKQKVIVGNKGNYSRLTAGIIVS